jgi:hypothetical protein
MICLEVSEAVSRQGGTVTSTSSLAACAEQETFTVTLADELLPGPATVTYTYTGILSDKLRGFYRSKYTVNGEIRWGSATLLCLIRVLSSVH